MYAYACSAVLILRHVRPTHFLDVHSSMVHNAYIYATEVMDTSSGLDSHKLERSNSIVMLDAVDKKIQVKVETSTQDDLYTNCMHPFLNLSQCLLVSSTCACHFVMSK